MEVVSSTPILFIVFSPYQDPQASSRNRGFAFVLYYNNACADYSRQKMTSANFKLDGNTPTVSWAEPKSTPDHSAAASQVNSRIRIQVFQVDMKLLSYEFDSLLLSLHDVYIN